jgi:MraZ protein
MALFLSTSLHKVDKKGRLSVPALFRASLEGQSFHGIVVYRSHKHPALEGCGIDRIAALSQAIDKMDQFSDSQDALATAIFSDCRQLAFDGEGRITLPPDLADFAKINEEACLVGRGSTFQIWNPAQFQAHQEQARAFVQTAKLTVSMGDKP